MSIIIYTGTYMNTQPKQAKIFLKSTAVVLIWAMLCSNIAYAAPVHNLAVPKAVGENITNDLIKDIDWLNNTGQIFNKALEKYTDKDFINAERLFKKAKQEYQWMLETKGKFIKNREIIQSRILEINGFLNNWPDKDKNLQNRKTIAKSILIFLLTGLTWFNSNNIFAKNINKQGVNPVNRNELTTKNRALLNMFYVAHYSKADFEIIKHNLTQCINLFKGKQIVFLFEDTGVSKEILMKRYKIQKNIFKIINQPMRKDYQKTVTALKRIFDYNQVITKRNYSLIGQKDIKELFNLNRDESFYNSIYKFVDKIVRERNNKINFIFKMEEISFDVWLWSLNQDEMLIRADDEFSRGNFEQSAYYLKDYVKNFYKAILRRDKDFVTLLKQTKNSYQDSLIIVFRGRGHKNNINKLTNISIRYYGQDIEGDNYLMRLVKSDKEEFYLNMTRYHLMRLLIKTVSLTVKKDEINSIELEKILRNILNNLSLNNVRELSAFLKWIRPQFKKLGKGHILQNSRKLDAYIRIIYQWLRKKAIIKDGDVKENPKYFKALEDNLQLYKERVKQLKLQNQQLNKKHLQRSGSIKIKNQKTIYTGV